MEKNDVAGLSPRSSSVASTGSVYVRPLGTEQRPRQRVRRCQRDEGRWKMRHSPRADSASTWWVSLPVGGACHLANVVSMMKVSRGDPCSF